MAGSGGLALGRALREGNVVPDEVGSLPRLGLGNQRFPPFTLGLARSFGGKAHVFCGLLLASFLFTFGFPGVPLSLPFALPNNAWIDFQKNVVKRMLERVLRGVRDDLFGAQVPDVEPKVSGGDVVRYGSGLFLPSFLLGTRCVAQTLRNTQLRFAIKLLISTEL